MPDLVPVFRPSARGRLTPPAFDAEAADVYGRALDLLAEERIPFLVGGALALNRHTGIWRDTKDLDVFLKPEDVDRTLDAFRERGWFAERVYLSWLSKAREGSLFVDFIHRNASCVHTVRDAWFERSVAGEVLDRPVKFLGPEDLIFSKAFVGTRYRWDGGDVAHTIHGTRGSIRWDALVELAGTEFAGLMLAHLHLYRWIYPAHAHHVPDQVLQAFAERARADLANPVEPFRGKLLDVELFEVDVEGWGLPDAHTARKERLIGAGVEDQVGNPH